MAEVEGFRTQLREIQGTMVDGKFLAEDSTAPDGQAIVAKLLDRCVVWSELVLNRCISCKLLQWLNGMSTRLIL